MYSVRELSVRELSVRELSVGTRLKSTRLKGPGQGGPRSKIAGRPKTIKMKILKFQKSIFSLLRPL